MNLKQPKFWNKCSKLNVFLWLNLPLAFIYYLVLLVRKAIIKKTKLPAYTITIGNFNVGGSGKTPTAIKIKQLLDQKDFNSCFLSKGYKGSLTGPCFIDQHNFVKETGDEALLLLKHGQVCIAKNRKDAVSLIAKKKLDLIILDDGFQNLTIRHDLKILVIDAKINNGNGFLMPAGPLRQTVNSALREAKIIIYIGKESPPRFLDNYKHIVITAIYKAKTTLEKNHDYLAFSALANNQKFFNLLKEKGYNVPVTQEFSDHYFYTEQDLINLIAIAKTNKLNLVTTSKDYVKIPAKFRDSVMEFEIELKVKDENKFYRLFDAAIKKDTA